MAGLAAALLLGGGSWAASGTAANAASQTSVPSTEGDPDTINARSFGSAGQGRMMAHLENASNAAARSAGGLGPNNGYRGGCGRSCSKAPY